LIRVPSRSKITSLILPIACMYPPLSKNSWC
jgi:hypothetical protein